jgi:phosphatidylserine synthase
MIFPSCYFLLSILFTFLGGFPISQADFVITLFVFLDCMQAVFHGWTFFLTIGSKILFEENFDFPQLGNPPKK